MSNITQYDDKVAEEIVEYSTLSADEIFFWDLIDKGKFSSLWNAESLGRKVVIKLYRPDCLSQWRNEKVAYDILGVHPNIAEVTIFVHCSGIKNRRLWHIYILVHRHNNH